MSLDQYGFRFFNDDGGEANATAYAAENTNIQLPLDTNVRLRMGVRNIGAAAPTTSKYMLLAAPTGTSKWFEVSPTGLGKVKVYASGGSPNNIAAGGTPTSQRLSAPPTGSPTGAFVAGRAWDDESGSDDVAIANGQFTEMEWCIRAIAGNGAINGDIYDFRVYRIPSSGPGATAPTIENTVNATAQTVSSLTLTGFTVTAANKGMFGVAIYDATAGDRVVASVIRNGQSATLVKRENAGVNIAVEIWQLSDPTPGTSDVVITMTGTVDLIGGVATGFINAFATLNTASSTTGTSDGASLGALTGVASSTAERLFAVAFTDYNSTADPVGPGTSLWQASIGTNAEASACHAVGTASYNFSWWTGLPSLEYAIAAVSVKGA